MTGDGTGGGGAPVGVRWGDEALQDRGGQETGGLLAEEKEEGDARFAMSRGQSRSMISLPPEPFMIMRSKVRLFA